MDSGTLYVSTMVLDGRMISGCLGDASSGFAASREGCWTASARLVLFYIWPTPNFINLYWSGVKSYKSSSRLSALSIVILTYSSSFALASCAPSSLTLLNAFNIVDRA